MLFCRADAESAEEVRTGAEKLWLPNVYNGGRPKVAPIVVSKYLADGLRSVTDDTDTNTDPDFDAGMDAAEEDWKDCEDLAGSNTSAAQLEELIAQGVVIPEEVEHKLYSHDEPAPWRVQIVSVVTTSSRNSTALEYVQKVYDHIKKGTNNDKRIAYQILCFTCDDGEQVLVELACQYVYCHYLVCHACCFEQYTAAAVRGAGWHDSDVAGELQHLPSDRRGCDEGGLGSHHASHHALAKESAGHSR